MIIYKLKNVQSDLMDPQPERFSTYGSEIGCDRRTLLNARDLV